MFENVFGDLPLQPVTIHTEVQTKNGKEMRPVENLAQLVKDRGFPEYVRNPVLKENEELHRTINGTFVIVEKESSENFVKAIMYDNDYQHPRRTVTYASGHEYSTFIERMPTKEELAAEMNIYFRANFCFKTQ